MFRAEWEGKLAINKHGDLPTEGYLPLVEIIYKLPHSLVFNPQTTAQQIYPRRRTKHDPRPMNSFMILARVVRIIASDPRRNVDLGDGQSCTRICQLIRWGANKGEWQIFLDLQEEFKKIHSFFFPKYDYRPKKNAAPPNSNDFIVMNSYNYDEFSQTQQKKRLKGKQNHISRALPYPAHVNSPSSPPVTSTTPFILPTLNESLVTYETCKNMHIPHGEMTSDTVSSMETHFQYSLIIHHEIVDHDLLPPPVFFWEPSIAVNCNRR